MIYFLSFGDYAPDCCSGTARVMKCVPAHFVAEQLSHLVLFIILGFRALTGCDTMLPLSGKGKSTCWKMFIKHAHLLTVVVRGDNVDDAWASLCSLYEIGEEDVRGIDDARHSLFVKAKRGLDMLPPTHGALELHTQGQTIKLRYGLKQTM